MNIAILGGGIGGLSAAIALKQEGFDVTVYERHEKVVEIGAGIVCWPNASFVLEQLGVLSKVAKVSGLIKSMDRYSHIGEPLGSLDINELNRLMQYPSYSIIRKDLMRILTQRVIELNIQIHYQHDVIEISDDSHNTSVRFGNGKTIESDIIIGSDGRMSSLSRKYVYGNNAPIYQGFINWIGVFEQKLPYFSDISVSDYWGVGQRFGIVPVSKTKAYWAAGIVSENVNKERTNQYKSELNLLFTDWPDPITKIINETSESRMNKIYVHDHSPIDQWYSNNVVLLGDAAHAPLPTSGQGACQALEDSWHLAQCLKQNTGNIRKAFDEFTHLRKTKTSGVIIGGRQLASTIFNQDKAFCKERNLTSKKTNFKEMVIGMAKGWSSGLPISV